MTRRYLAYRSVGDRWLVELPSHWRNTRLRYLCDVETGSADTVNADPDGAYPFIVRSPTPLRASSYTHDREAVLTAGDGAVGEVFHHLRGKFLAHQRVYVLSNFRDVLPRYFFYYFSALFRLMAQDGTAKTTVDSVRRWMLTDMPFALPGWDEQRAIADYLDRETAQLDTLIAKQEQLIATLRERREVARAEKFDGMDWNVPLRSVVSLVQTGPFGSQLKSDEYVEGGRPIINPSHIGNDHVLPDSRIAVSEEKASALARHAFAIGDLVVARRGELARCAVISESEAGYLCGTGSALLRPMQNRLNPSFLAMAYGTRRNRDALQLESVGSTMDSVNADIIGSLRIPLPPVAAQERTVAEVLLRWREIDTLISKAEQFIALAKERRSALITAAVTGQIDVTGKAA